MPTEAAQPGGGTCPACGASALGTWRLAHAAARPGRAYPLLRCRACGSGVTDPAADGAVPDDYRSGSYAPARGAVRPLLAPLRALALWRRRRLLGTLPAGARVVDVGAGDGRFARALSSGGYRVVAIEPHRAVVGVSEVVARPLEGLDPPEEPFDAAVLWHVLEHLDEPEPALRRLRSWLRPGGRLLVSVPNLASVQARLGGDRWFHQDVPRHRVHFTADGLLRLLRRSGYEPARTTQLVPEQALLGMWQTLLNRTTRDMNVAFTLTKPRAAPPPRRDVLLTAVAGPPLVPLALVLEGAAAAARRGGSVAVLALRRER